MTTIETGREPEGEERMSGTTASPKLLLSELTLNAIQAEATRAHLKHGRHSMLYGPSERCYRILGEEVGEVARELNDAENGGRPVDRDRLARELIQVGAMAATWIEALIGPNDRGNEGR